jgi:hypothetical protein
MLYDPGQAEKKIKPPETVRISDKQAGRVYPVHWRRAGYLVNTYPSRFEFENTLQAQVYTGYAKLHP